MKLYSSIRFLLMFGVLMCLIACTSSTDKSLAGCWNLTSWHIVHPDGSVTYPYGKDADGELCLYQNHLFLTLAHSKRPPLENLNRGTLPDSAIAAASRTFFHYSGTYSLTDSILNIHVTHCNVPNWEDTTITRNLYVENDRIKLISAGVGPHKNTLIWTKSVKEP